MTKRARAKSSARARGAALLAELGRLARDPLLAISLGVIGLSFLGEYVWVGALLRELSFLLALLTLAPVLFFLARRQLARGLVLLACAAILAHTTYPYLRERRPTPQHGPTLAIIHAHTEGARITAGAVSRLLAARSPDVLSLTGLNGVDARRLSALRDEQFVVLTQSQAEGRLLWVRRALLLPARSALPALLRVGRCQLALLQVELPSLFAPSTLAERRRRITELTKIRKEPRRVYVGHFGSASDSADLAQLQEAQELRDARLGHGRQATVPELLGPMFGLPVDHVLLHGWLAARELTSEAPLVSGAHRTLHATLELTEPRCAPRPPMRR